MIFVIKIAARGDLLLAGPAFRYLRETRAGERIVLIVGESCRDVAEHLPYFDEIHTIDDHALFGGSMMPKIRAARQMLTLLRGGTRRGGGGADSEVVILHRDWRYSLIAYLARIDTRRGFSSAAADHLLTHSYHPGPREHHEAQYLGVVGAPAVRDAGTQPFWRLAAGEREAALAKAAALGLEPSRPTVGLGFGGGRNVKMAVDLKLWSPRNYEQLARKLVDAGYGVVWLGDRTDADLLTSDAVGVRLAGRLTLPESAAIVGECHLVVANDTMLLHMAGALGVPALGIFGPTDPAHAGPRRPGSASVWLGPETVPCTPCHQDGYYPPCEFEHRCMRDLPLETVLRTAMSLLRVEKSNRLESISVR